MSRPASIAIAAALLGLLIAACGGDDASGPTPSPAVSPVPSSVAIDLAEADRLHLEGDTDAAVVIYSAAALRGTLPEQQHGLWALARIQFEHGESKEAAQNTAALLATEPEDEVLERRAHLLLGYAEMAQGNVQAAREALEAYVRTAGPATPYAQVKLAEIAAAEDAPGDAARGAEQALAAELPLGQDSELRFSLARYQEDAEDIEGALLTLQSIADEGGSAGDGVEALWETARLAGELGDEQRRQDALRLIIVGYPSYNRALEALEPSTQTSIAERALVLFRHRENAAATEAYASLLADHDPNIVGEAHYRLGILAERAGDPDTALNEYAAAIGILDPTGGAFLDDAYWDRGLTFESLGRLDEAVADYTALLALPSASPYAGDALMRAGMIRYKQGRPGDAAAFWESRLTAGEADARVHLWLARAYGDMGNTAQQQAHLGEAAASSDYYGLRATAELTGHALTEDPSPLAPPAADWASVEAWLTSLVGPELTATPTPEATFFASPGWERAEEVMEAGLWELAIEEMRDVIGNETSAWALYRIARRLSDEGYVRSAALAAGSLLGYEDPPPTLLRLVYPAKYLAQVNAAAAEYGVSPVLLLALVRQESFFDASAGSVAGALGLTQVIPETGRNIAAQLGIDDFRETQLFEPETSLRFGAYYLASQIEGFGGNLGAALAAYNGGPGNAARWSETSGTDTDLLVETIDFDETRLYLELVFEHYAHYRYAYGVTDTLSLPMP